MNGSFPYTSSWIGSIGEYGIYEYLNQISSNTSNYTTNTSNILESHIQSQIYNTSNILQTQITNTSNLIYKDAHSNTIVRISATNKNGNIFGSPVEMLFHTVDGNCNTKINEDGELMVYHPVAPLPAGFSPGWWGVENRIANVIIDTQGLRFDVTNLQAATATTAITNTSTASAAVAGAAAGAATATATTAAVGATIAGGDYGTVALGVAGGALFSVLGYLSYQAQTKSNLDTAGYTTEAAQVQNSMNTANVLITENIKNIALAKGFINSNITTQQLIPSLRTSNLNLIAGNITSVNTINATTGIFGTFATTNNTNLGIPTIGNFGGIGDKIILSTGTSTTYPSSIGMNTNDMWLSTNSNLRFYNNGSNSVSITSNFTSNNYDLTCYGQIKENNVYLSNIYASSNVVKSLIIYDTPQVNKKSAFYCVVNNIIYPDGGNVPYYAYHINLTNYTKTGYLDYTFDPYRIFKISCFYGPSYFQMRNTSGLPDICEYTIYMSNKQNSGGSGTKIGLNICAIGTPQSYSLDIIPPQKLFILRNASENFNYISIVSKLSGDVRVIIECMLS